MPRTTAQLVAGIIEVDPSIPVAPFIEVASELVTEVCEPQEKPDGTPWYTATRLELIERWLTAHFYAIRDPRTTQETAGSVAASYQSRVDLGLDVTHYGQQAKRLDTAGGLAQLDEEMKEGSPKLNVGIAWLGTPLE
jgi:hypothetical protein